MRFLYQWCNRNNGNEFNKDTRGLPCGMDYTLVQYPGLPVEGTVATSPIPPPLGAVRKSASVPEQPHPGNTSEKMDQYEIKMVYLDGHTILVKRVSNSCLYSRFFLRGVCEKATICTHRHSLRKIFPRSPWTMLNFFDSRIFVTHPWLLKTNLVSGVGGHIEMPTLWKNEKLSQTFWAGLQSLSFSHLPCGNLDLRGSKPVIQKDFLSSAVSSTVKTGFCPFYPSGRERHYDSKVSCPRT